MPHDPAKKKKKGTSDTSSTHHHHNHHVDPNSMQSSEHNDIESVEVRDDEEEELEVKISTLSKEEVSHLRHMTLGDIKEMDEHIEYAVNSFFENRIQDCETALRSRMADDPLAVTGAGLIAFVRCMLSMEQAQADVALELLTKSSALAMQVMTNNKGAVAQGFARVFQMRKSAKDSWLSASEFRAKTIHAESQALRCFVLVMQQSVSSVLKAGIALNKASSNYRSLYTELEQRYKDAMGSKAVTPTPSESPVASPNTFKERDASLEMSAGMETLGVDRNSVHCVEFGLGAVNLVVSILPSNVRSMLRFIGVEGDRQYGLRLVRQCFMSDSLLSPFASALLLAFYGFLPSTSAFLIKSYLPVVHEIREAVLQRENMKSSLLHLWMDGRTERVMRKVQDSEDKLERCLEVASNPQLLSTMPQLRDFVVYDQACNFIIMHHWRRASRALEILSKTSKWANSYYLYAQAACLETLEQEWAEGISDPDGEADSDTTVLRRIVGADKAKELDITFLDITTRADVSNAISQLYWEAAQRTPITLGGKPNHHDQFVVKRLEEMLSVYGVDPSLYVSKKKLNEALEPMPAGLRLRNTVPIPIYEVLLLTGVAHQIPAPQKERMQAKIDKSLMVESTEAFAGTLLADYVEGMKKSASHASSTSAAASRRESGHNMGHAASAPPHADVLPAHYRVLCLCAAKAMLLANSELKADRVTALKVIEAVRAMPQLKDRQWTLSYAQAFVLYEKAYIAYQDESRESAETILNTLHKQYDNAHYFMHARVDLKAHLASYELLEQKRFEKAKHDQKTTPQKQTKG